MLRYFCAVVIALVLAACDYPLRPYALTAVVTPDAPAPAPPPAICDLNEIDGSHVVIMRACNGRRYYLPYELSGDSPPTLAPSSLLLRNWQATVFLLDLSLTSFATAELRTLASGIGVRAIPPYPFATSIIAPATTFPDFNRFSMTMKHNPAGPVGSFSRTLIVQVVGRRNAETFTALLGQPNAVTLLEYVDVVTSSNAAERVSIQLRVGNLRPTNLTR